MQNKIVTKYIDDRVTSGFASYSADTGASIVVTADNTETAGVTGMNLVCVIMGATRVFASNGWQVTNYGNFDEMVKLLGYAYNNFLVHRVIYNGMSLTQLPVAGGETDVVGVANVNVDTVLPSKARMANLIRNVSARDGGRCVAFSRAKPHHQRSEPRHHRGRSAGKERRAHHGEYRA